MIFNRKPQDAGELLAAASSVVAEDDVAPRRAGTGEIVRIVGAFPKEKDVIVIKQSSIINLPH